MDESDTDEKTDLQQTIESIQGVTSITAQLLLLESYEITFEIFDHAYGNYHPWNLALCREKETYQEHGPLFHLLKKYHLLKIGKLGISFSELISMEREHVDFIVELCTEEQKQDNRDLEEFQKKQQQMEERQFQQEFSFENPDAS